MGLALTSPCVNCKQLRPFARPFTIAKKGRPLNVTAVIFLQRNFLAVATFALLIIGGNSVRGAEAYVIADSQTGYVLDEQKPRDKRQVGSLTKVATAMVVLDWAAKRGGDLNQLATIPPEAFVGTSENNIGFQPGDLITLRDLLYAALVQSDNIAAYALANHVGIALQSVVPTVPSDRSSPAAIFVGQMNALGKTLKMERTRFLNPNGIDGKERPYSTAADLARLTRYATSNAGFRFYVSQKTRQISFRRAGRTLNYLLRNTNELLGVNGVDGVKTGRTARAGDCLILSATRESEIVRDAQMTKIYPRHLIVILLGSADRFGEGAQLLARGWQLYDQWAASGRMADPKKLLD
jgi:serine-type D-Ala-D-Ala carboxypeptidase (penicillin-binding protein 5/6)